MIKQGRRFIVLDIGGTHFRIGLYDGARNRLSDVRRFPTPNFLNRPGYNLDQLQNTLVESMINNIADYLEASKRDIAGVGVSFAGPVNSDGMVLEAPTIWGRKGKSLDLARILVECIGLPVRVINDISAAAWRYSEWYGKAFCVITVSSGIGNKVFYNNHILVNERGYGGEIGHCRCDFSEEAWECDCGEGKGHLGAIASGRGIVKLARKMCGNAWESYSRSYLYQLIGPELDKITSSQIVTALHYGDPFTVKILRRSQQYLARMISCLYNAIGIDKYIIIGGFAVAVGEMYIKNLEEELKEVGCFGMELQDIEKMIFLGEPDDDHSLIGVGKYLAYEVFDEALV